MISLLDSRCAKGLPSIDPIITPGEIVIHDGQGFGGSFTKIGKGKLTLTKSNTYTEGTIINRGTLLVKNRSGSGTGSGTVQVNGNTLGGIGKKRRRGDGGLAPGAELNLAC